MNFDHLLEHSNVAVLLIRILKQVVNRVDEFFAEQIFGNVARGAFAKCGKGGSLMSFGRNQQDRYERMVLANVIDELDDIALIDCHINYDGRRSRLVKSDIGGCWIRFELDGVLVVQRQETLDQLSC